MIIRVAELGAARYEKQMQSAPSGEYQPCIKIKITMLIEKVQICRWLWGLKSITSENTVLL